MADLDQGKLLILAEEGVHLNRIDLGCCRPHRYYRWRMETIKVCWMLRTSASLFLVLLMLANMFLAAFTLAAPTQPATTSAPRYDTTTFRALVTTPAKDEGDVFIQEPPSVHDPTRPRSLSFLKNPKCKLHKEDGHTVPRRCGLRELDLPSNKSGVHFWNPQLCHSAHCQCVATKEIRREKRTVLNNKTEIEYRRFRLFECV